MKKIIIFCLLFMSFPAFSQMIDVMGSLGVQGSMIRGETQSVGMGLSALRKNKLLQDINQSAIEIKAQYMGNYGSVSKKSLLGYYFNGLNWNIGSYGDLFYIELNQIDNKTCFYLMSSKISAIRTELNSQPDNQNCLDVNQIRFVFD